MKWLSRLGKSQPPLRAKLGGTHSPAPVVARDDDEFADEIEAALPSMLEEVEAQAAVMRAQLGPASDSPSEREALDEPLEAAGSRASGEQGPSWMSADEWSSRLAAYRKQGRSSLEIRKVAAHLQARGPGPTKEQRVARAKSLGQVSRDEYLSGEQESLALMLGPDGLLDAALKRVRDRLIVVTPAGWINPRSRTAATRAGLWSFQIRGTSHHKSAARRGDFSPGAEVTLVREPNNEYDRNAIAVYARNGHQPAGYVPRGYAKRLAKLIDAGADLVAVSTRGSGVGKDDLTPQILACERRLFDHLNRL